jgi:hypothetical protein
MKAHENWKKCEEHNDQDLTALIDIRKITNASSNAPLQKIKRNLIINSIWGILIVLSYIMIMIKFPLWQVQLCLGIVMSLTLGFFNNSTISQHPNILQFSHLKWKALLQYPTVDVAPKMLACCYIPSVRRRIYAADISSENHQNLWESQ